MKTVAEVPRRTRRLPAAALLLALLTGCATLGGGNAQTTAQRAAEANYKLGIGYMQTRQFDLAIAKLQKAVQFDPEQAEAYNALGVLYEQLDNGRAAEEQFRTAIELKPGYVLARINYARLLCANGNTELGEQQWLTVADDPDYVTKEVPYTGAGVCATRRGDLDAAETFFSRALDVNPGAADALLALANLSVERERYGEARGFLQRYHRQVGYNPVSLKLAIQIEERLGDEKLKNEYQRLLQQAQAEPNA